MEKLEVLQQSRLFENLLPDELQALADLSQRKLFGPGDVVFREGEVGDSMYVIESGEIEVSRRRPDGQIQPLALLRSPEFFGEMSLIDKEYRSATVAARSEAALLHLSSQSLHRFARVYRNGFTLVVINIARVLSSRLRETNRKLLEQTQRS